MTLLEDVLHGDVEGVTERLGAGESTAFEPSAWRKWETEPAVRDGGGEPTLLHVAAEPHPRYGQGLARWEQIGRLLLDAGLDVNAREQFGDTPLHLAVAREFHAMVQLLLERGADVNAENVRGLAPIDRAEGDVMFALLLGRGAHPDGGSRKGSRSAEPTLIERYARYGYDSLIRTVLDAGADLARHPRALATACQYAARTPSQGHDESIRLLLERGADPTSALLHLLDDSTIDEPALRVLLERGADPNVRTGAGETPLAVVVKRGLHRHARTFIDRGADIHVRVFGGASLYDAAQRAYESGISDARLVKQLLKEAGVGPVVASAPEAPEPTTPSGPSVGARVTHAKFGGGVITKVDGDKLDVTFDSGDKKAMLARFVRMG